MKKTLQTLQMHRAILTRTEKKRFLILSIFFLFTSIFDIAGIGAIGSFLIIMMKPAMLQSVPIIKDFFPKTGSAIHVLTLLGGMILATFFVKTIFSCIVQKKLITYCFTVGARIRVKLMEQYLYAPYSYFVMHHTSDMITRILSYAHNYSAINLVYLMTMLVHSFFVLAIIAFLWILHPILTLVLIIMFSCMLASYIFLLKTKLNEAGERVNQSNQCIVQSVQEGLLGIKEVRVLAKENFFLDRLKSASEFNAESNGFISVYQKLPLYFLESGMFVVIIMLCLGGLGLGVDIQIIISLCGTLVAAGIRLLPSLYQMAIALINIQSNQHTLETIYQNIFDFNAGVHQESLWPKKIEKIAEKNTGHYFSKIEFDDVSYQYGNAEKRAIDSLSFTIKKGQSIGIIGPSGAGKSTLADLMLGLLRPSNGNILMDGMPNIEPAIWIKKFAYIPQDIYLLDATIKQNIVFGESEALIDTIRLQKAIQMAQLEEVIANLPHGVNSWVGENGIKLSGGQRQRIALARAFYYEREIIVMDEATAALDNETEQEVVKAIKELHQIKTLIIIAHRYTTVQHCDIIFRLEKGRMVETGTFDDVIRKKQLFSSLSSVPIE